jgi:hypothetical protein
MQSIVIRTVLALSILSSLTLVPEPAMATSPRRSPQETTVRGRRTWGKQALFVLVGAGALALTIPAVREPLLGKVLPRPRQEQTAATRSPAASPPPAVTPEAAPSPTTTPREAAVPSEPAVARSSVEVLLEHAGVTITAGELRQDTGDTRIISGASLEVLKDEEPFTLRDGFDRPILDGDSPLILGKLLQSGRVEVPLNEARQFDGEFPTDLAGGRRYDALAVTVELMRGARNEDVRYHLRNIYDALWGSLPDAARKAMYEATAQQMRGGLPPGASGQGQLEQRRRHGALPRAGWPEQPGQQPGTGVAPFPDGGRGAALGPLEPLSPYDLVGGTLERPRDGETSPADGAGERGDRTGEPRVVDPDLEPRGDSHLEQDRHDPP